MAFVGETFSRAVGRWRDHLTEGQWDAIRMLAIALALAVGGAVAYVVGQPLWLKWQDRQALAQARAFATRKDYPNMLLALRRAAQLEPTDLATWQEVARDLAQVGSPEAVSAREQAARLNPADPQLRAALVEEALRFGRYDTARGALAGFSAAAQRDVEFHRLSVALALAQGRPLELERQLAGLIAVEPGNFNARFSYAALRLWNADPLGAAAARATLTELQREPSVRIRATIELLSEAARQRDIVRFQAILTRSLALFAPQVPPDFGASDLRAWNALLTGMQQVAEVSSPSDAALLARWLSDLGRRPAALAWLEGLPPNARSLPAVADEAAELSAEEGNLTILERRLREGAWGVWPDDARTMALASRLQVQHFDPTRGRATWGDAVAACGGSISGLRSLGRLAIAWHDPRGAEQAWLAIITADPRALWAYEALRGSYLARQDSAALLQLYNRWITEVPKDDALASEWITLGCLLDRVSPEMAVRAPLLSLETPGAAAAQAAVLWRRGEFRQAWEVFAALAPAERSAPDNAFWLALVRADLGPRATAIAALADARRFPRQGEELALLRAAGEKIGAPGP